MVKIPIYSVIEKRPPIDEQVIKWDIDGSEILDFAFVEEYIAIPDSPEELELIPKGVVTDMIWSSGFDMRLNDKWSYTTAQKGE
jgi:hypothetical protein